MPGIGKICLPDISASALEEYALTKELLFIYETAGTQW